MRALIERLVPAAACLIRVLPLSDLRFYAGHQSRFHYFGLKGSSSAEVHCAVCVSKAARWKRTGPPSQALQFPKGRVFIINRGGCGLGRG